MGAEDCGDYDVTVYVAVSQEGSSSRCRWGWAIKRHSSDLRLVQQGGFLTEAGARLAGENVLKHLLSGSLDNKDLTG